MKVFCYMTYKEGFWFRLFGYGLSVTDRNKQIAPFSVRNGYTKELRIGKYGIRFLRRE